MADKIVDTAASIADSRLRCLLCSMQYVLKFLARATFLLTSYLTRLTSNDAPDGYCRECTQSTLLGLYSDLRGKPSAKTEAISRLLDVIHERGPEKTIIYSQFTTMLDSIQVVLKKKKVEYVRCEFHFAPVSGYALNCA